MKRGLTTVFTRIRFLVQEESTYAHAHFDDCGGGRGARRRNRGRLSRDAAAGTGATHGFCRCPGEKGGQDPFGAYDIVSDWPKPISSLPGLANWTWGAGEGVFAETPNRVLILQRGLLPNTQRPKAIKLPQLGPNIEFPIGRLPWRDATSASPPGALEVNGKVGDDSDVGVNGTDFLWSHIITVADAQGNIIESWTQWDKMFRRPHAIYISPYDPQKRVFVVDDYRHAVFIFSHDGKQLLKTLGEAERARPRIRNTSTGRRSSRGIRMVRTSSPTATRTRAS